MCGSAENEGAKLAFGGQLEGRTPGYFMAPALLTETLNSMRINQEEVSGLLQASFVSLLTKRLSRSPNDTIFGLSSGICTTSLKYAEDFKHRSTAGMAMVNLPTAGVDYHVPFGGRKGSSYGPREQGAYAREFYTSIKTAYTLA